MLKDSKTMKIEILYDFHEEFMETCVLIKRMLCKGCIHDIDFEKR